MHRQQNFPTLTCMAKVGVHNFTTDKFYLSLTADNTVKLKNQFQRTRLIALNEQIPLSLDSDKC